MTQHSIKGLFVSLRINDSPEQHYRRYAECRIAELHFVLDVSAYPGYKLVCFVYICVLPGSIMLK